MNKKISILVDNDSWIVPYAKKLESELITKGFDATYVNSAVKVENGWINFMLGCTKILGKEILERNKHNIVVHESDLPHGRGFAPMTWQIIEGKNIIPICLIEAQEEVDSGVIWIRDEINLKGTELHDELRNLQGIKTIDLCCRFVDEHKILHPKEQTGYPTYYKRRKPEDSFIDIDKTILDQFNLLRTVDNERYPAYFEHLGVRYKLLISK